MTIQNDSPALPRLPPRPADSHKGDYGRALLVGGSRGMTGAIALAGMGALRAGAGLVTLATPGCCLETVASFNPCYMTRPLPDDGHGRIAAAAREEIERIAAAATCVACGPGLGRSNELTSLVGWMYRHLPVPMVVDADGLFALAQRDEALSKHAAPRVLTPHLGEFARLVGRQRLTREEGERLAGQLAAEYQFVLLLKGHRTLVTDGQRSVHNQTGNPGMATGGSGDVLTGVITGFVCQGLEPFEAAQLGAHVHGLAGDLAADELGQPSLIASDLLRWLPQALVQCSS